MTRKVIARKVLARKVMTRNLCHAKSWLMLYLLFRCSLTQVLGLGFFLLNTAAGKLGLTIAGLIIILIILSLIRSYYHRQPTNEPQMTEVSLSSPPR